MEYVIDISLAAVIKIEYSLKMWGTWTSYYNDEFKGD